MTKNATTHRQTRHLSLVPPLPPENPFGPLTARDVMKMIETVAPVDGWIYSTVRALIDGPIEDDHQVFDGRSSDLLGGDAA